MKPKSKNTTPTTASSTDASLLTLATLSDLAVSQRVELYVSTETKQRLGFLLQGKILFTLGDQGMELLRAAGIKPSSLYNARRAEWVLHTFTGPNALKNFTLHNGTEATELTEATYDGLTMLQCELLQKAFTRMGQVLNRPDHTTALQICALPDWDDNLECYFENGLTRAGLAEKRASDQRAVETERTRIADLERQIAESQERDRLAAELARNAPPAPPPVVSFNEPPAAAAASIVAEAPPANNIVAFTPAANTTEETTDDADQTDEQAINEYEESRLQQEDDDDDTAAEDDITTGDDDDTSDSLTPEEIGSAVYDATAAIEEHNQGVIEHLGFTLQDLEDGFTDNVAGLDLIELTDIQARLQRLLDAVTSTIASKATPQDELPEVPPATKSRANRKAKLAA
jgi:hypothetical protein